MLREAMFLNLKRLFVICICLLTLATIDCSSFSQPKSRTDMREYIHSNGLIATLNQDLTAKETENGLIVEPAGGSGGETFTLTGYEKVSDGYIEYSESAQSKYSERDFQNIRGVIENTSPKNNRKTFQTLKNDTI